MRYPSFTAFKADILDNARTYAGGVLHYTSGTGIPFTFYDNDTTPRTNGAPINYAPPYTFNSPHIRSAWDSGVITIAEGSQLAKYDFRDPAHPVKVVR